ncbi:metallophosphoesterase [Thalassovita taeanensis]|uniref:3',5'-cyclic AMP phosphodiesterase CpdA n=1 Tax=Thalassovita taeanensis TaxID=657014 RepID=A0A1H9K5Z3_9RHOB|nr:metallophosphoesterase [Thalassovita taeanensis]SEQ94564.1 3',5'-cyclic AMP phosphodiesterase CpdA [Thalassovita taeanensis]
MLILHLSDIHFKNGEAGSPMDQDHHVRTVLLRDLRQQCETIGATPDVVLVSGDIAYAGDADEYDFAQKWLEQVCETAGCDTSTIMVIPGNHDVQQTITKKHLVQAIHNDIKATADSKLLPGKLAQLLNDEDSRDWLYRSIENYNDFATQYFCDLLPPDRTTVERRFELNDGSTLCITGLNSAFVSSQNDKERSLYVDPSAQRITHEDGVTHVVMCHHPYNWLANGQQLEDHLNVVSKIQIFGHEHTNRVVLGRDWIRVAASAAHPDRREDGWEPGYNLLELSVDTESNKRTLDIKAHIRVWQNRPTQFVPKMDGAADHFSQSIALEAWTAPQTPSKSDNVAEASPVPDGTVIEEDASMTSLRTLSIRYFKLTFSKKLEIAGSLDLFEEADTKLPDHERFRRVLLRARERDLLDELKAAIDAATPAKLPEQEQ